MTRTINTRSITVARRAMLSAAMAAAILGTPLSAMAVDYDGAAMASDLLTLQAQTMPMPSAIAALPDNQNESTSRLDVLYNFVSGVSSLQAPASAASIGSTRLNVSDLYRAAETVYNTLDARCTYWLANAAPPGRRITVNELAERIEALEAGAQITVVPPARTRATLDQVDALMTKSENFIDGLSAMGSYRPWEAYGWRYNLTSMTKSMDTFYAEVSDLCGELRD